MNEQERVDVIARLGKAHMEQVNRAMRGAIDPEFPAGWGDAEWALFDWGYGEVVCWSFRECAYPLPGPVFLGEFGNDAILEFNAPAATWRVLTPVGVLQTVPHVDVPRPWLN